MEEIESKLDQVISKIEEIEKAQRNRTLEIWKLALGVLTPLAVVGVGIFFDRQLEQRAAEAADRQDRLSRLALIPEFLDALTVRPQDKQVLAIRSVSAILPEDGQKLLEGLQGSDLKLSEGAQGAIADELIDSQALVEVNRMFSHIKSTRIAAFERLISGDFQNHDVIRATIYRMATDLSNSNGVFNSLTLLNRFSGEELRFAENELARLLPRTFSNGPRTSSLAEQLLKKLSR